MHRILQLRGNAPLPVIAKLVNQYQYRVVRRVFNNYTFLVKSDEPDALSFPNVILPQSLQNAIAMEAATNAQDH